MKTPIFSHEDCDQWIASPNINPKSNRNITTNGPVYTKIKKQCDVRLSDNVPNKLIWEIIGFIKEYYKSHKDDSLLPLITSLTGRFSIINVNKATNLYTGYKTLLQTLAISVINSKKNWKRDIDAYVTSKKLTKYTNNLFVQYLETIMFHGEKQYISIVKGKSKELPTFYFDDMKQEIRFDKHIPPLSVIITTTINVLGGYVDHDDIISVALLESQ